MLVSGMLALSLAACSSSSSSSSTTAAASSTAASGTTSGEVTKIALVILSGDHGFTGESVAQAEARAEEINSSRDDVEITVKSCSEASEQITEIENLIAEGGYSSIMLWPTEGEALRSAAQTIIDAGIKLVVYDRLIDDFEGLDAQIMGDNFAIGNEMGTYLNEYFADDDQVNYLRFVGDSSTVTTQRSGGMDEVLDTTKFNQINETFVTDWSTETSKEQMENWLNGHTTEEIESLDLIVTHDDEIVSGIMSALEDYSGDASLDNLKLITSVGGTESDMQLFEETELPVKFITWFFSPSFIREAIDLTVADTMGEEYTGTAVLDSDTGIYLIPSFSISNAGGAHYTFDEYRASSEYEIRYSISDF